MMNNIRGQLMNCYVYYLTIISAEMQIFETTKDDSNLPHDVKMWPRKENKYPQKKCLSAVITITTGIMKIPKLGINPKCFGAPYKSHADKAVIAVSLFSCVSSWITRLYALSCISMKCI